MSLMHDEAQTAAGPGPVADTDRFYGKYRGSVSDNRDPLGQGRIQALVPEILYTVPTGWAVPCMPYAGPKVGFFAIPPVDAGVWIEFEAGDISRPIWVGGWWGSNDGPVTPRGSIDGPEAKLLRTETGMFIMLDDGAETVTVSDRAQQNQIEIDVRTGAITVKAATRVVLATPRILEGSDAAPHPAVLGDNLLQYLNQIVAMFNSHLHPGQVVSGVMTPIVPAPPLPSMPAATPTVLSTKVTLE